ncbi:MAG TPA: RluA family pseudouridine synthase [Planctomycetota bacterium]|nr:RluA family pseudouridine synthase [Planctomycetota bacterium]
MARDLSKPIEFVRFVVTAEEGGMRLDHLLAARVTWRSRTDVQRRILAGTVLVNGQPRRKATAVHSGDRIDVLVDGPATEPTQMDAIPIQVIYEDDVLIVLNKAPGTVVHPVGRHVNDTLVNALHIRHHKLGLSGAVPPMIVHRLDRDTSGVLVLAKDEQVRKILGSAFESREVRKTYLAIVRGEVVPASFHVNEPIGPHPTLDSKVMMACVQDGRPAETSFEVLERHASHTLLRCRPHTGRQHQIRVHLMHAGHPILCDHLYGQPGPLLASDLVDDHPDPHARLLSRQALHAESLEFEHPLTHEILRMEAELPADLACMLDRMPPPPAGHP